MGVCFGRERREPARKDSREDLHKSEYNKLLLEHLEKNKENFEVIAKSISALSAVNITNTPASQPRINSLNETSNACKCNCREHNSEAISGLNCAEKPKLKTINKPNKTKTSNLISPKAHIRSINLISTIGNKTESKHKRYLIEVSDSDLSDLVNRGPSSSSVSVTSSNSDDLNIKSKSYAKDLNRKINKITKFKVIFKN